MAYSIERCKERGDPVVFGLVRGLVQCTQIREYCVDDGCMSMVCMVWLLLLCVQLRGLNDRRGVREFGLHGVGTKVAEGWKIVECEG